MIPLPFDLADPRLAWLLLLAPLAALLAGWVWRRRIAALAAWASRGLWKRVAPGYRPRRLVLLVTLLTLAVAATAAALARPRWGVKAERVERRGVDVVLVVDTSLSMGATDVQPDRLTIAKLLARQLVDGLAGHRLALVQVEGEGDVLSPLTLDRAVIDLQLDSLTAASLPTPGSRLSRGLGRALLLFPPDYKSQRVVVLLSDGEDFGEDWDRALPLLASSGAVVHAIALGTRQGSTLRIGDGYKLDENGAPVVSRLQPAVLQRVAKATGGLYIEAARGGNAVTPIVEAVSRLGTRAFGSEVVRQQQERFQWPLALAVGALLLLLAVSPFRRVEAAS